MLGNVGIASWDLWKMVDATITYVGIEAANLGQEMGDGFRCGNGGTMEHPFLKWMV